jgi:hypothetical protein
VTSAEGPVAGADVCAHRLGASIWSTRAEIDPVKCTTTDDKGAYSLELDAALYGIATAARGYTSASARKFKGTAPMRLDWRLHEGGREVTGRLLDLDGKSQAKVMIYERIAVQETVGGDEYSVTTTGVETAPDGAFSIWLGGGTLGHRIPGAVRDLIVEPLQGDDYFVLPGSTVSGTVVDRDGKPVAGARVAESTYQGFSNGYPDTAVRTDTEGRFELDGLAPGKYALNAMSRTLAGGPEDDVVVPFASKSDIEIVVRTTMHAFPGRVVDPEGKPVADCRLTTPAYQITSGVDGRLEFTWRRDKAAIIQFRCPRHYWVENAEEHGKFGSPIVSAPPANGELSFVVYPGTPWTGRATHPDGSPAHSMRLQVVRRGEVPGLLEHKPFSGAVELRTDSDGRFEGALAPGQYEFRIDGHYPGPSPENFVVRSEAAKTSFTIGPSSESERAPKPRELRIVDQQGQPVSHALVFVSRREEEHMSRHGLALAVADEKGVAVVDTNYMYAQHVVLVFHDGQRSQGVFDSASEDDAVVIFAPG